MEINAVHPCCSREFPAGSIIANRFAGAYVSGATVTSFGIAATNVTVVNPVAIHAVSPPQTSGSSATVNVIVKTPGGTSPVSSADQFTYFALSTVSEVSPNQGLWSGGSVITVFGTNFASSATAMQ